MNAILTKIIAAVFSFLLICCGEILRKSQVSKLRLGKEERLEQSISTKQIIRRIICSYLIIIIGFMIFCAFLLLDLEKYPIIFSIYWGICFLLVFFLLILAYDDYKEIIFYYYGTPLNTINNEDPGNKDFEKDE